jgi:RNA polymerase subunit RPABC4/transcription elongation factor Spt4
MGCAAAVKWMSAGVAAFLLLAAPGLQGPALGQEPEPSHVRLDAHPPDIEPWGDDQRCPAGYATFHQPDGTVCAKCGPGYTAVETRGHLICVRGEQSPQTRPAESYRPELAEPGADGGCPPLYKLAELAGRKACVRCRGIDVYHAGRCHACQSDEALEEVGGEVRCLSCPGGSRLVGTYAGHGAGGRGGNAVRSGPAPHSLRCSCSHGMVFGWGPEGYGCHRVP